METLESRITELERRVDAVVETLQHIITALEGMRQESKEPIDFSHIEGHIQHVPPTRFQR